MSWILIPLPLKIPRYLKTCSLANIFITGCFFQRNTWKEKWLYLYVTAFPFYFVRWRLSMCGSRICNTRPLWVSFFLPPESGRDAGNHSFVIEKGTEREYRKNDYIFLLSTLTSDSHGSFNSSLHLICKWKYIVHKKKSLLLEIFVSEKKKKKERKKRYE